ncbi:MAG: hypothetical protein OQJ89_13165, partial [Kangiellaceae bacterium]|nr:hypothetical protein [Kangiellaceae bacterium]
MRLKKISDSLTDSQHKKQAAEILSGKDCDGISLSHMGGNFGPTWDKDTDYSLAFLEHYQGINAIEVHLPSVTDLSPVESLKDSLTAIRVGEFSSKSTSIAPLKTLTNLNKVSLCRNYKGFIEVLETVKPASLRLTGYREKDLNEIPEVPSVTSLFIGYSTLSELELSGFSNLEVLTLEWIKKLVDFDFLTRLSNLKALKMSTIKSIEVIPNLEKNTELESIILEQLTGLKDISSLVQ